MRKLRLDLKLKNDEQRKSIAKNFHDVSKALFIAAFIESIRVKELSGSVLQLISIAILCVAAGLSVESKIKPEIGGRKK